LTYLAFRLASAVMPHLPEALGYLVFGLVGDLLWLLARDIRERVAGNLARAVGAALPAQELATLTRASLRNLCWNYYELFHSSSWNVATLASRIQVEGDEHLEEAHRGGRGLVLLFAHVGSLEALAHVPPLYPRYRFVTLNERMKDLRMHELLLRARMRRGLAFIPLDEALRAVRLLRRNWILVVAADRDLTAGGVMVPFFGKAARLPVGAVRLGLRLDVPVSFMHAWRETSSGKSIFHIRIHPPFRFARTGDLEADTRAGVAQIARELEPVVRARPEQWLANYTFWPAA
jgi:KDO2-lipid IV(A) lauroyltransferase